MRLILILLYLCLITVFTVFAVKKDNLEEALENNKELQPNTFYFLMNVVLFEL